MIIMPDADLDQAADALVGAGFGAAGERCMAISVAVPVGEETADRLIEKLVPKIEALKVGPYTAGGRGLRPRGHADGQGQHRTPRAVGHRRGRGAGRRRARLLASGLRGRLLHRPAPFDRVTPDMEIYQKEIFGPVLSTVRARESYEEALKLAMDHEYGNGTAIFTRDGDAARDFANRINVGMVGINVPIPVPLAYHTFGGWKKSVFGDLNQHGPDAFRFYTKTKTVTARWPSGIKEGGEFTIPVME
jgi:malonate-semialdehyde dehydrogenase (acetylating)/methylmalonate-semialdehyde dehydrogenase